MGQVVVGGLERGGVGVWGRVDRGGGKNQGGRSRGVRMGGKPNQSLSASAHVASDAAASIIHSTRPTVRNHFLDGSSPRNGTLSSIQTVQLSVFSEIALMRLKSGKERGPAGGSFQTPGRNLWPKFSHQHPHRDLSSFRFSFSD